MPSPGLQDAVRPPTQRASPPPTPFLRWREGPLIPAAGASSRPLPWVVLPKRISGAQKRPPLQVEDMPASEAAPQPLSLPIPALGGPPPPFQKKCWKRFCTNYIPSGEAGR